MTAPAAPTAPTQIQRLNHLLDGPAPFERGDLELSAAGMVEIGRDGLTELTGVWTLPQIVALAGVSLCACTDGGRNAPLSSCPERRGEGRVS